MNLNIDDYEFDELRDLLGLPEDFTAESVDTAKKILEGQLTQKQDMDMEEKRRITFFLDSAAGRLRNAGVRGHSTALDKYAPPKNAEAKKKEKKESGTWAEVIVPTNQYGSNILIDNPNSIAGRDAKIVDGRAAMSGDAPPGYINPINVRTIMQGITVDSRFRKDYFGTSASQFSVELPHIQRKCVSMRVASIEMPMTYYAISEGQGNNTFIIGCNYDMAQLEGSRPENRPNLPASGFVPAALNLEVVPQYNYNFEWLPPITSTTPTNNTSTGPFTTIGGCIRIYPITLPMIDAAFTIPELGWHGYFPPGATEVFGQFHNSGLRGDKVPAWRVKIPDGNYECRFNANSEAVSVEQAINNAIALAEPGWLDQESGFAQFHACRRQYIGLAKRSVHSWPRTHGYDLTEIFVLLLIMLVVKQYLPPQIYLDGQTARSRIPMPLGQAQSSAIVVQNSTTMVSFFVGLLIQEAIWTWKHLVNLDLVGNWVFAPLHMCVGVLHTHQDGRHPQVYNCSTRREVGHQSMLINGGEPSPNGLTCPALLTYQHLKWPWVQQHRKGLL